MKKFVDGNIVDMTDEEIADRQAEEQEWADGAIEILVLCVRKEIENLQSAIG